MHSERHLDDLNPQQAEAVDAIDGPVLIAAGAGTGKTRVVTRRIARILDTGIEPWRVLAITFTNKAAEEMRRRVSGLVDRHGVHLSTFHSFCAYLLRRESESIGLDRNFSIYDQRDRIRALQKILDALGEKTGSGETRSIADLISDAKNQGVGVEEYSEQARSSWSSLVAKAYEGYEELLRSHHALDFDDLLLRAVQTLSGSKEIRERYQERYRYILVDEFQDTNPCQYDLVRMLSESHRNLCVTGDPDQSIYSWRGATPENLLQFEEDFPESRTVLLEQNYRSRSPILESAVRLVGHNRLRKDVSLWTDRKGGCPVRCIAWPTDREEAAGVVDSIEDRIESGTPPSDIAIIYRVNALSRSFEEVFLDRGVPYILTGSTEFYRRREIKDLLAYVRTCVNPHDDIAFARILNVPRRGIGTRSIELLESRARETGAPLQATLISLPPSTFRGTARRGRAQLCEILVELQLHMEGTSLNLLEQILEKTSYIDSLGPTDDPMAHERRENVSSLLSAAAEYDENDPEPSPAGFLEKVSLLTDHHDLSAGPIEAVQLMSFHAAKGLEFPVVYLVAIEEGILPHHGRGDSGTDVEEERRLLYVGMTRAREELVLSRAERRHRYGREEWNRPSPFIGEIGLPEEFPSDHESEDQNFQEDRSEYEEDGIPHPGDRIRHPSFGEGEILDVRNWGPRTRVRVRFDLEGTMELIYEHAQLTRI